MVVGRWRGEGGRVKAGMVGRLAGGRGRCIGKLEHLIKEFVGECAVGIRGKCGYVASARYKRWTRVAS